MPKTMRVIEFARDASARLSEKLGTDGGWGTAARKWAAALSEAQADESGVRNKIAENEKGKYVQAERQVIKSDNPQDWESEIINYVNNIVRGGKDLEITLDNGEKLKITGRTAWKLGYRNGEKEGKPISDKYYLVKGNASGVIDEVASVSKFSNSKSAGKAHSNGFGKDGFDYRTAYFRDLDGGYYKLTLSVGKNADGKEIYNIGNIKKVPFPMRKLSTQKLKGSGKGTTDSIAQKGDTVNSNIRKSNTNDTNTQNKIRDVEDIPAGADTQHKFGEEWNGKIKEYGAIDKGENPARDIKVPRKISKTQYVSQFARTAMEAGITPNSVMGEFEKRILDGTMTHERITNKKAARFAKQEIEDGGFSDTLDAWLSDARRRKLTKRDMAVGMELYNQAITNKDIPNAMKLAAELAAEATLAGQSLQAVRMLKQMSPDGQLYYIERSIHRMNKEYRDKLGGKFRNIKPDPALMEGFLTAKDEQTRNAVYDKLCQNIADQIPSTGMDKWNAWRYLCMLGNLKTHTRNIVGNASFVPAVKISDYIGAMAEKLSGVSAGERTKSIRKSKAAVEFAKQDVQKMMKTLRGGDGKYATINNIDAKTLDGIRDIAVQKAKAATYRDENSLAQAFIGSRRRALASESRALRGAGYLMEGVMPFANTPLNIAKQGLNYSPFGVFNAIYKGVRRLADGEAYSAADVVNYLSKGLTGTGIMALGFALSRLGFLVPGDDDDDKENAFNKLTGGQSYAIKIGDRSYSIDWLVPLSLPLFIGAQLDRLTQNKFSIAEVTRAMSTITEPMLDLSVLSSVNGAIEAARYNKTNAISAVAANAAESYLLQALPTLGGQLSRIIDGTRREYSYVDKNSKLPQEMQKLAGRIAAKVPFASYLFEPALDEWGRTKSYGGLGRRIAENTISPGYYSERKYTDVDKELERLYRKTGVGGVFPSKAPKKILYNGTNYFFDAKQYNEFKKMRGEKSLAGIQSVMRDEGYGDLSDSEKVKAIKEQYDIAAEKARIEAIAKFVPEKQYLADAPDGFSAEILSRNVTVGKERWRLEGEDLDKFEQVRLARYKRLAQCDNVKFDMQNPYGTPKRDWSAEQYVKYNKELTRMRSLLDELYKQGAVSGKQYSSILAAYQSGKKVPVRGVEYYAPTKVKREKKFAELTAAQKMTTPTPLRVI